MGTIVSGSACLSLIMASAAADVWLHPASQLVPIIMRDRDRSSTFVLGNNALIVFSPEKKSAAKRLPH
jgi:hypothetical protein